MKIALPNCDSDMTARIFRIVFTRLKDDVPDPQNSNEDDETVERLANEFAKKVPEHEFSRGDIQAFLLENKGSPHFPAKNLESWMVRTRREKVLRMNSWVTELDPHTPPASESEESTDVGDTE